MESENKIILPLVESQEVIENVDVNECNICFDSVDIKEIRKLKCCKGKRWCAICEIKVRDVVYPKIPRCPFCRKNLLRIDTDIPGCYRSHRSSNSYSYSSPRTPVNSIIRQASPEPLSPQLSPVENKRYFNTINHYENKNNINVPDSGVNIYSFSLSPDNYQPSGSVNRSRINNRIDEGLRDMNANMIGDSIGELLRNMSGYIIENKINISNYNSNSNNLINRRVSRNITGDITGNITGNINGPEPFNENSINYSSFRNSAPLIREQNSINNINNFNTIDNNNELFNNYINFRDDMFNMG